MKLITPTYKPKIGKFLARERIDMEITQEKLAKKIGVSAIGLSHYETCIRIPNIERLDKWANALGMELEVRFIKK